MGKPKKKTGCIIAAVISVVAVVGVVFGSSKLLTTVKQKMTTTPYGEVSVEDLSSYVNISGNVSSSSTTNVSTELMQKVGKINVKVGDSVKKGDILCELDSSSLRESYEKLSKSSDKAQNAEDYHNSILQRNLDDAKRTRDEMLNKAQQAINDATYARDEAYDTYNNNVLRRNALIEEIANADPDRAAEMQLEIDSLGEINEKLFEKLPEYDEALTAAKNAYVETKRSADQLVQAAQDAIDAEQFAEGSDSSDELRKLHEQIEACSITAPADGVVTQISAMEGSLPMNGMIMTIENTDELIVRGKVQEADILRIEEGMPCEIKTSATGSEIINGSIKRIERIISSIADATMGYTVEIAIDDPDSKLLIGMNANVKIILDRVDQVLSVPYEAVRGGENEGRFVLVAEKTDTEGMVKVVKKEVEIGFEGDYYTEIKSGDLKEGDIVFTGSYGAEIPSDGAVIPDPTLAAGQKTTAD